MENDLLIRELKILNAKTVVLLIKKDYSYNKMWRKLYVGDWITTLGKIFFIFYQNMRQNRIE
jgi:hypothetical protein